MTKKEIKEEYKEIRKALKEDYQGFKNEDLDETEFAKKMDENGCKLIQLGKDIQESKEETEEEEGEEKVVKE